MRKLARVFGICALAASFGAGAPVAYGQEPLMTDRPMGDFSSERVNANQALFFGGGLLFLGSYGTSALVGTINDNKADRTLAVPLVGPWLDLGDRNCERRACDREALSTAVLIASGVLQGVGLAGVVSSFFVTEDRFHLARAGRPRATAAPRPRLAPAPLAGGQGSHYGLALVGTFLTGAVTPKRHT